MCSPFALCAGLLLGVVVPNVTFAASFDCSKAKTLVEHTICTDAELSSLDDKLAAVYSEAMKDPHNRDAIRSDERKWLKARDECRDVDCLQEACARRLSDFGRYATGAEEAQPPGSEAVVGDIQFPGHYDGTTKLTTEPAQAKMVIDVSPSDMEGHVELKLKTWNGFDIVSNMTAETSPAGKLNAVGVFAEPGNYVFRESRSWDCRLTGVVRSYTFRGNYRCFPKSVTGTACPQMPGYPCAQTAKMEGTFNLEKFNPSDQ